MWTTEESKVKDFHKSEHICITATQIRKESTTVTQVLPCPSHSLTKGVLILTLERSFCIFKQLGSYPIFTVCHSFYLFLLSRCIGCFALGVRACPMWEWGTRGAHVDTATALLRVQLLPLLPARHHWPTCVLAFPVGWRTVGSHAIWSRISLRLMMWALSHMFIGCLCSLFCEVAVQFPRLHFSGIACLFHWFVELLYVFWTWALGAVRIANLFSQSAACSLAQLYLLMNILNYNKGHFVNFSCMHSAFGLIVKNALLMPRSWRYPHIFF